MSILTMSILTIYNHPASGFVAQSAARLPVNPGVVRLIKMTHEIISTTILLVPLIQAGQLLSVYLHRRKYVYSVLDNRLEGLSLPSKSLTARLEMT